MTKFFIGPGFYFIVGWYLHNLALVNISLICAFGWVVLTLSSGKEEEFGALGGTADAAASKAAAFGRAGSNPAGRTKFTMRGWRNWQTRET